MHAERILVVTDEMEVGGSQRQIVHLLRGVKACGRHASLLYFRRPSFLLDALREVAVDVHQIDKKGRIDLRFLWRLIRFLRAGRFDVVHCFSITAEMWVRLALTAVAHTRLISSVRGLGLDGPDWHWRARRWVIRGSAAVISNSGAGAELVAQRCGIPVQAIDVVHNGLPLPPPPSVEQRAQARATLTLPPQRLLLLFVGRLVAAKNIGLLLRALALLPSAQRPLTWLAGEGPERAELEHAIRAQGLERDVHLLGERSDTAVLMCAADMLVLCSREEGLSNVILEAMGSALAVVATAVGGSTELVEDGVSGKLVANDDAASLAEALRRLASDAAAREALGRAARERVEQRFTVEAMVRHTLSIYDRCVQRRVNRVEALP
ncbi:MAG: glycosyltransferase [Rhodanobacteraceae bacterium]|nr:glycosyltransferase [Rhodanobacteraceae bacterium]